MNFSRMMLNVRHDLRVGLSSQRIVYLVLVPLTLVWLLKAALPIIDGAKPTLVAAGSFRQLVVDRLEEAADVVWVKDRAAVVERVRGVDDVVGVFGDGTLDPEVIVEGNELRALRSYPGLLINEATALLEGGTSLTVHYQAVELAQERDRRRQMVLVLFSLLMMVALFPALVIIEDRETKALETLRLSPLSFAEYLGAKSILAVDFGAVILAISSGILLGWNLSWSLWGVGFLAALPSALLLIVLVAALAKNQMMAMSVIRPLFILVILPIALSLGFDLSDPWYLKPFTSSWAGQSLLAAVDGRVSLAAEAFVWSLLTGLPLVLAGCFVLKQRLKWS